MAWQVVLHHGAAKFLEKLDERAKEVFCTKIEALKSTPGMGEHLRHCQYRKLRVGDYRIIYRAIEETKIIRIILIEHRKTVYDKLRQFLY